MRAQDLLTAAFPDVVACGETLPPGDLTVPMDHPLVRQTVEDCLHEAMDLDGLLAILRGLEDGTIERVAIDTPEPSPLRAGFSPPSRIRSWTTRRSKSAARKP